ncbi:hypothetical protein SGRIM119S_01811 [Streptomyces griseorubiginosus]
MYSSATDACTRCRLLAMQIWPACSKDPHAPTDAAFSTSTSSITISAELPAQLQVNPLEMPRRRYRDAVRPAWIR